MDYKQVFAISAAGMTLERTRVDVAAMNMANAHTIQGPNGTGYRPMSVVARTAAFAGVAPGSSAFAEMVERSGEEPNLVAALPVVSVEQSGSAPRMVYEPGHPLANEKGFLAYPGVDPATEMMTLMSATRAYEANVAVMNTARTLAVKALEIGGGV